MKIWYLGVAYIQSKNRNGQFICLFLNAENSEKQINIYIYITVHKKQFLKHKEDVSYITHSSSTIFFLLLCVSIYTSYGASASASSSSCASPSSSSSS